MKFMKLGSKPDALQADGNAIRHVGSELSSDLIVVVDEYRFYLHKFPLLSKSNLLQKLARKENTEAIVLSNLPGGFKSFEICAKFCYGMSVTLNAYNVVAARCAAEFLEMSEDVEKGNLIFKIEVFLSSSIFRSWKDSIIVLQSTSCLLPWSEDLNLVARSVDSIASKCSVDPADVTWSYKLKEREIETERKMKFSSVPKDWWIQDLSELEIDLYKRVMITLMEKIHGDLIGEALMSYAIRWLPDTFEVLISEKNLVRNKVLIEEVILLLPDDGCSCSFLLKLLKLSVLLGINASLKDELVRRISLKLDEASVNDLLVPANSPQITVYDVQLVQSMLEQFEHICLRLKNSMDSDEFVHHGSWLKVGKLIDGYLAEIAHDPNLSFSGFISLSQRIPNSSRPIHDGLYKAIDIYLQEHPSMTKSERKKICSLMDVKKLTIDASMHAAQNERLPLRVVVQVLFFEQIRSASIGARTINSTRDTSRSTTNTEESEKNDAAESCRSLGREMNRLKISSDESAKKKMMMMKSKSRRGAGQLLQSRSRRIIEKLWPIGRVNGALKSSENSAGSQSPTSIIAPVEIQSSSRNRRHSVS